MHILLTNDDSHTSPLFRFAIDILKPLGDVTIVVPQEEQSWTGKSMSRFKPLALSQMKLQDDIAHCVNGTPADCVNLGVHHLCQEPPDLVVSDIIMPGLTGLELAQQLRERYAELPILLVSGYSGEKEGLTVSGTELLPKPFTSSELASKVRELLGPREAERAIA